MILMADTRPKMITTVNEKGEIVEYPEDIVKKIGKYICSWCGNETPAKQCLVFKGRIYCNKECFKSERDMPKSARRMK